MALKAKLSKDDWGKLSKDLQEHYSEADGAYVLQAEGVPDPKTKELRETNIRALKDLDETRARLEQYKDVDVEEYKRLKAAKDAKPPAEVEVMIREALEKETKPLRKKVETLESERDTARAALRESAFVKAVTDSAVKTGVLPDFTEDVIARARAKGFTLTADGALKALTKDGQPVEDNGKEVTLDGWLKTMPPAFFGVTRGGGAPPMGHGGTISGKQLIDPDPLTFGRNAEKIAKGELEVVRTTG
jgi:hypothetical protein